MKNDSKKPKKSQSGQAGKKNAVRLAKAIRESELRYRRLFETAQDGILIANAETGKVEDANPYLLNLLGYTREEIVRRKVWQLHADSKAARKVFEELRKKEYLRFDHLPMKGKDGRRSPVECVGNVYQAGEEKFVQYNIRNIAEHVRTREELLDNSPIPIWVEDFSEVRNYLSKLKLTGKTSRKIELHLERHPDLLDECVKLVKILDVNRACVTLHHAKDKAELLAGLEKLVTLESREALAQQIIAVAAGRLQVEKDSMVRTLDGDLRHVNLRWNVAKGCEKSLARVIVSTEDITERIRANERLVESERRFRSLIENSHDAIAMLDVSGRLVYESASGFRITGYSVEERIGGSGFDLVHPDDIGDVQRRLGQVTGKPRAVVGAQFRARRKDGEWRWLDATATNLLDDRAVGAIVVNYRDITEKKQAEDALAEARELQSLLLVSVGEGIHGLDIEGRIMFENAASLDMFGWEAKEMLGQNAHALIHHHRADGGVYPVEECPIYLTLSDGETRRVDDEVFFRKDGTSFPIEYTCSAIKNEGGVTGVVVSFQDVTERRRAERALKESEERFRAFAGATSEGVFFHDQGQIVDVNLSVVSMFGYDNASEVMGRGLLEFVAPESRDLVLQKIRSGSTQPFEAFGLHKDGTTFAVEASGRTYEYRGRALRVVSIRDITERKMAEDALKQSEEKFFKAFQASPDANVMTRMADGRIVDVNESFCRITEYSKSEVIGRTTVELNLWFDAVDRDTFISLMQKDGHAREQEFKYRVRSGRVIDALLSAEVISIGGEQHLLGIVRDITERKKIEEDIRREKMFSDAIINSLPSVFYLFNEQGRFLRWNDNFEKVTGYSAEEIAHMSPLDFFEGHDKELIQQRIGLVFTEGAADAEAYFVSKDGSRRPYYFTGNRIELNGITCLIGMGVDVAERRRAEKSLRDLSLAVNASGDVVFMTDRTGLITSINAQFTDLYGYTPDEVVGKTTPRILKSGKQGPDVYERFWQTILRGGQFRGEVINQAKDGRLIPIEESVSPFFDELGNIAGFLAVQRNISARKQAEDSLRLAEEKYRALVEQVPITMYIDDASGSSDAVYISPQIETLLGYSPADFAEDPQLWHKLVDPRDYQLAYGTIRETMEEGISISEYRMIARDGHIVWVRDTSVLIRGADGTPRFIQGFFEDITAQRQAEQSQRESEEKYRAVIEQAAEGIALYDGESLRVVQSNSAYCAMLGYTAEEMTSLTIYDIVAHPREGIDQFIERVRAEKRVWIGERQHRRKDGSLLDVEVGSSLILLHGKESLSVIVRDITERKKMEQALIKSERDYRDLFNSAGDAILILEPQNEIILQVNATSCRLYGFEYGEMIGRSLKSLTKDVGRGEAYMKAFIRGEASSIFESTHVNKGGEEILVLINSSLIEYEGRQAILALVRDVTELKRAEDALRRSEARLVEAQRIAHLGHWEWDIPSNVVWWSDELYRIFGLGPQEFEATVDGFLKRVHPEERDLVAQAIQNALDCNAPYNIDHRVLLPDGTEKFLHEQGMIERDESGNPMRMVGISLDVTERKRAEENVQRQLGRLRALHEVDTAITGSFDMRTNLTILLRRVTTELGVDSASVLMLNPNLNLLEYAAGYGFRTRAIEKTSLRADEGYAGRAVMQRSLVRAANLEGDHEQFSRASLLAGERFVSYFGVPLTAKGIVKGVLEVFHRSPLDPDQDWLDFLQTLGGQAAIAIENAQLFSNLQQSNFELLHAYDATIEGWSRALDLRDKETEGHTQRVTNMAIRLGRKFGLSDDELKYMRWGGLLHDIGKMGVPDVILFKKEALSSEEMDTMRRHTAFAYEMLSPIRYLKNAVDIPYCHHEKWDGTGYPRKLKGEQIPLPARIFAVADVYDAITSDRPYRDKWGKEKAISYIREQAGLYFDPNIVKMFLQMIEEDLSNESSG